MSTNTGIEDVVYVDPQGRKAFRWIAEPREIEPDLRALAPDTAVVSVTAIGSGWAAYGCSAGKLVDEIEARMRAQAEGVFTLAEVAAILAHENEINMTALRERMEAACDEQHAMPSKDRSFTARDPGTKGAPVAKGTPTRGFVHWMMPQDVSAMLNSWQVSYRFAWPRSVATGAPRQAMVGVMVVQPAKPLQRQRAQEAAILAKLVELGFDAKAVPPAPAGKPSPAKQAVRAALGYSPVVMNKAWQRLRKAGAISDA